MSIFEEVPFIDSTTEPFRKDFSYQDLIKITGNFVNHPNAPKLPDGKKFRGFNIQREDVLKALGVEDTGEGSKTLFLAFGYHNADVDINTTGLTIAIAAYGEDGELIKDDERVFDYSEPCPCKCPKDIFECPPEDDVAQDEG